MLHLQTTQNMHNTWVRLQESVLKKANLCTRHNCMPPLLYTSGIHKVPGHCTSKVLESELKVDEPMCKLHQQMPGTETTGVLRQVY